MSHVVIVGAGPAGATLAFLLASRGIDVTLLERRRNFDREFRGEVLMPSGMQALEQMGLAADLAEIPTQRIQSFELLLNGEPLFALDGDVFADVPITAISQPAFLQMVVSRAERHDGFRFLAGANLRELITQDGRVVGVRAKVDDREEDVHADLVIGADGRNSAVRKLLDLPLQHVSPPMDIVWAKIPCPQDWDGIRAYFGKGHLLIAYRTWDGNLQLGWVILKGTFGELRSRGVDLWVEEMSHHVSADLAAHLQAHKDDIERPFLLDVVSDCVANWSAPGGFVIGDAAHAMSPVGGQGVNIALRDAVVAANHLVPLLSAAEPVATEDLDRALSAIETERMHEVATIQKLQAQPPKVALTRAWWGEMARKLLATLVASERFRAATGERARAFPFGITQVDLEV